MCPEADTSRRLANSQMEPSRPTICCYPFAEARGSFAALDRLHQLRFLGPLASWTLREHLSGNLEGPMSTETTKQRVLEAVEQLPPDATVEQAMERLYFIAKVEEGLRQAEAGKLVSHEDVKRRLLG